MLTVDILHFCELWSSEMAFPRFTTSRHGKTPRIYCAIIATYNCVNSKDQMSFSTATPWSSRSNQKIWQIDPTLVKSNFKTQRFITLIECLYQWKSVKSCYKTPFIHSLISIYAHYTWWGCKANCGPSVLFTKSILFKSGSLLPRIFCTQRKHTALFYSFHRLLQQWHLSNCWVLIHATKQYNIRLNWSQLRIMGGGYFLVKC